MIKDTSNFLNRLRQLRDILEGAIICTMDVVNLYPHIPHEEGLHCVKEIVREFKGKVDWRGWSLDEGNFVDLPRLVLANNYFEYDGFIGKS